MSSTKLLYSIKSRVDSQIEASNRGDGSVGSGDPASVGSSFNTNRMQNQYMSNKRSEPMDPVDEGTEYTKNVHILH